MHERTAFLDDLRIAMVVILAGIGYALLGAAAERLASVWPADEASRRRPGWRTALLAFAAAIAAGGLVWRAQLPAWATGVDLAMLALMVGLTATDLDQRRLPHLLLDPLIALAVVFVPFNPSVKPLDAVIGAASSLALLWVLGRVVRGGLATGDLYLTAPIGLLLGWPSVFVALFVAALLSAAASLLLLARGSVGLKSYIPFGPFLVAGAVATLLREPQLLGQLAALLPIR
ncbi:MAG: A24 family peptidase [Chloroflexota bacterium]|nr:A24 family peptidase [Chloroflexota bacterium]